jgi:hypothetical protein
MTPVPPSEVSDRHAPSSFLGHLFQILRLGRQTLLGLGCGSWRDISEPSWLRDRLEFRLFGRIDLFILLNEPCFTVGFFCYGSTLIPLNMSLPRRLRSLSKARSFLCSCGSPQTSSYTRRSSTFALMRSCRS